MMKRKRGWDDIPIQGFSGLVVAMSFVRPEPVMYWTLPHACLEKSRIAKRWEPPGTLNSHQAIRSRLTPHHHEVHPKCLGWNFKSPFMAKKYELMHRDGLRMVEIFEHFELQ
jgi:hypothetical protein